MTDARAPSPPMTFGKRLAVAGALLAFGAALRIDPRGGQLPEAAWALWLLGLVVGAAAVRARRADRRRERELAGLDARWPEIEAAVRQAEAAGRSPVRALRAIGIGGIEARRRIMTRLHGEPPTAAKPAARPQSTSPAAAILQHLQPGHDAASTKPWRMP